MNLLLLRDEDFASEGRAVVRGRRHRHVRRILRSAVGDLLCVGRLGGRIGRGRIVALDERELALEVELAEEPPPPLAATLVLALPRPPVFGRVLSAATSFGVKHIALLHARRVEKTYWQASAMGPQAIEERLVLGLEQARDTVLPKVSLHRRFRPFVEDVLPGLLEGGHGYLAHALQTGHDGEGSEACPAALEAPCVVAVGPEGGFLDYEIERMAQAGMRCVHLGERALRCETAVAALLSRAVG